MTYVTYSILLDKDCYSATQLVFSDKRNSFQISCMYMLNLNFGGRMLCSCCTLECVLLAISSTFHIFGMDI